MRGSELSPFAVFEPERTPASRAQMKPGARLETIPITVIKIGGSLLGWPELPTCLSDLLQSRVNRRVVLIVGGGAVVDEVRRLDHLHSLGDAPAHALALRAMDLTARLVESLVLGLEVIEDRTGGDRSWSKSCIPILAPRIFLQEDAKTPDALPENWSVTSDSIAARVAERWGAQELLLLKSAALPTGMDCREAASLGLVDSFFPEACRNLPRVSYLNIKGDGTTPILLATRE